MFPRRGGSGSQGSDRFEYLQALVTEFQDTDCQEAKEQVLANLANFSYDPANYEHLRRLQVPDLFLDMLTEDQESLVEYGMGGLCNLCLDKVNKAYILQNRGVELVTGCLSSPREETVLSAITALMYLVTPAARSQITAPPVVECMLRFSLSENKRLSNLAEVFLQDYCSPEQLERARSLQEHSALGIPLPSD
ncbi:armadillo repeat-containing protein 7 [Polyodon spathula]|uniref:armadillo repeat-containing protein 7 n=1 Tax=Polyodon spathula TaxID=7913 RepID=UPI001B7E7C4B|nr:armadillo repeat-containing protein 7 [Polyodon spathula]XP_041075954.1 armadillo repeat-containing protein 7 [Polyodon spathula]